MGKEATKHMVTGNFNIENGIDISNTTVSKAREALSTEQGFKGWWTKTCAVDAKTATFAFPRNDGSKKEAAFRVERISDDRVELVCTADAATPDWVGTRLSFVVKARASGVRVELVHARYPAQNGVYDECTKGWAFFLGSLKDYLETGVGKPFGSGHMGEKKAA